MVFLVDNMVSNRYNSNRYIKKGGYLMYNLKYRLENLYRDIRKSHNQTRDGHINHSESFDELYQELSSLVTIFKEFLEITEKENG